VLDLFIWNNRTAKRFVSNLYLAFLLIEDSGVPLSHRNMVGGVIIAYGLVKEQMRIHDPRFEYRTIAHLPTAHIAGMQGYFVITVYMGGPTYWMSRFDFAEFLEYNRRYKISFLFTVPPIFLLMAKSPTVTDQFDHLKLALGGAAPMGKDLQGAVSRKLGKGKTFVSQTWGLSESTGSVTLLNCNENDFSGSVSRLLPNMQARYVHFLKIYSMLVSR
jgi:4-coumarate--CoA ligase